MFEHIQPELFKEAVQNVRACAESGQPIDTLNPTERSKLLKLAVQARSTLQMWIDTLDPVRPPAFSFTLSDPRTVGEVIGKVLADCPSLPLAAFDDFYGSGVYAIYYSGSFTAYSAIRSTSVPIYVGSAQPKTLNADTPRVQGRSLTTRLREHSKSVLMANNLNIHDFSMRYLVVQSGWEKAAEDYLIRHFQPVWNTQTKVCPGLGKHGDKARTEQSRWDTLHPGRTWAGSQKSLKGATAERIAADIQNHFLRLITDDPGRWRAILNQDWLVSQLGSA